MNMPANSRSCLAAAILFALPAAAMAGPLVVVDVGAPAINCVFNTTCKVVVNDTVGNIAVPGAVGTAGLQSRAFVGTAGAPANGKNGYMYRVDLTQAVAVGNVVCVAALKLDYGPMSKFHYKTGGPLADVFVVTSGGLGNVALASADQVGNVITFNFSAPVCPGAAPGKGDTSFFFGLAAVKAPKAITAQVQVGSSLVNVAARAKNH
ncbi:MAG: hypothetical protein ABSF41_03335 [Pseudolabrys sp.]|jgi:hypothetical protein